MTEENNKSNYPESVIKYTESVMQTFDKVNLKRKSLIVRFQLTPNMLFSAVADASMEKLILSNELELTTKELTAALIGCAFDSFICERLQDIQISSIGENGKLCYNIPGHVEEDFNKKVKDCLQ
jgi:hypothetical protein